MNEKKIGIVGLGKLGLPMMAAFYDRGFSVKGFDIDKNLIELLRSGINPYAEPGIDQIIKRDPLWGERFFDNFDEFIDCLDLLFLIVPTPTVGDIFDRSYLEASLADISSKMKGSKRQLTIVVTSTVNPGDCDYLRKKYLTSKNIDLVYSPEFIALGSVLNDMLHPEVVLLGGDNDSALDLVFRIYSRLYKSYPEFHRLSYFESEVSKIALNTFVTTKISFANMIGMFVHKHTKNGISAQKVLDAIGGDSRVGRKYFKFGTGYGGPCFPRDNRALSAHLEQEGIISDLPKATDETNEFMIDHWVSVINSYNGDAVIFVGVAYKPGTDFIDESFMLKLEGKINKDFETFYVDDICKLSTIKRITKDNYKNMLGKYDKVLVLVNYGDASFISIDNKKEVRLWN